MNQLDFTDEAAVEEYLERVGIEYRFQCFHENEPEACHRLGDWLEFPGNKDYEKAARVFKSNCDLYGYARSCSKYGSYALLGKGLPDKNVEEASAYLKKACEAKEPHAEACDTYGLTLVGDTNTSVRKDPAAAGAAFTRGCQLGDPKSCIDGFNVYMLRNGFKDVAKAFQLVTRGCELEDYACCANLARMYKRGDGVHVDEAKAEELKDKAVELRKAWTERRPNVTFGL